MRRLANITGATEFFFFLAALSLLLSTSARDRSWRIVREFEIGEGFLLKS